MLLAMNTASYKSLTPTTSDVPLFSGYNLTSTFPQAGFSPAGEYEFCSAHLCNLRKSVAKIFISHRWMLITRINDVNSFVAQ